MSIREAMTWSLCLGLLSSGCAPDLNRDTDLEPRMAIPTPIGGSSSDSSSSGDSSSGEDTGVVVVTESSEGGSEDTGEPEWTSEVAQIDSWCHEDGKCDCWQRFRCYETNDCTGPFAIDSNGLCATIQYANQTVCAQGDVNTVRCQDWCDETWAGPAGDCYTMSCTTAEDCVSPGPIGMQ